MAKQLISALLHAYAGKPILVIGGGPSAKDDLERINPEYVGCVISANQHGFHQDRFKVDFIVNVDFTFGGSRVPMSKELGKFGVPIINRWSWADYRLPDSWSYSGDSGLTAIAVAAALGGHPVLFTGFDRNTGNRKYFWQDPPADPRVWEVNRAKAAKMNIDNMRIGNQKILELARYAQVRAMSGPMRGVFKTWDENEKMPAFDPQAGCPRFRATGKMYRVLAPRIFLHPSDPIDCGFVLPLTDQEARTPLADGKVCLA